MTQDFNPRYHLDSEQDHHLSGDEPKRCIPCCIAIGLLVGFALYYIAKWVLA